jgi:hypothetical protein
MQHLAQIVRLREDGLEGAQLPYGILRREGWNARGRCRLGNDVRKGIRVSRSYTSECHLLF